MIDRLAPTRARKNQGGYALLLVVFLTALVLVSTMSIGLRILTEGRREKEQEMIWRGKQYTRGIKLYYAASIQRPHEQRGWLVASDLCRSSGESHREP
jgi:hypothetical protein